MKDPATSAKLLSSFYCELNSLRTAVSSIPILGTYIDQTLSMSGQKYVEERLEYLIDQLRKELEQVQEIVMDNRFLQTEEGFDLIVKTFQAAARTRQREKLKLFAKVLRGAYTKKATLHDPELYIKLIDELNERELEVALLLYDVKVLQNVTLSAAKSGSDAFRLSKEFTQFTKDDLEFILPRLEKTGLIKELVGSFLGYGGGVYNPTAQLTHFVKYIENNS